MFQIKVVQTKYTFYVQYPCLRRKSFTVFVYVEKYRSAGQATDDSMAHAHCAPDT